MRFHRGAVARAVTACLGAEAVTLGNRILLSPSAALEIAGRTERARRLLAHELAHVAQYSRLGTLSFLFQYAAAYAAGRLRRLSHEQAYLAIPFERQATAAEFSSTGENGSPPFQNL